MKEYLFNLAVDLKQKAMRVFGVILLVLGFNLAIGQSVTENPVKLPNGNIKVEGVDPFGAQILVTYNTNKEKVYQERTFNGETTYAHFDNGVVTEYGTVVRPAMVSSDITEPKESNEP
ncbi:MAG: hypothetical protein Salg2KO_11370 [Salibacteraceae bacterium]